MSASGALCACSERRLMRGTTLDEKSAGSVGLRAATAAPEPSVSALTAAAVRDGGQSRGSRSRKGSVAVAASSSRRLNLAAGQDSKRGGNSAKPSSAPAPGLFHSRRGAAPRSRVRRPRKRVYSGVGPTGHRRLDLDGRRFTMSPKQNAQPFLTDLTELRRRARQQIEKGAVTDNYQADVAQTIELLQTVLATEIVCVLRYTMHAVAATGIDSESVKEEFKQHAAEEQGHMLQIAERINQLGGTPNFNPQGLETRAASEYGSADNLIEMIKENLVAERVAIEHYRELVRFFGEADPTTRVMLEGILTQEEEHASDMHDLLVAREGGPFLKA
jgi:bacterioferritin